MYDGVTVCIEYPASPTHCVFWLHSSPITQPKGRHLGLRCFPCASILFVIVR
jgi:hypothetical protein